MIHRYLLLADLPWPDPYIAGVTESRRPSPIIVNGRFSSEKREEIGYHSENQIFESEYSWIPTTFQVSDDGMDIHIQDYINGLGPRNDFPTLYRLIEKLFLLALPHFEKTLAHRFTPSESPSGTSVSKDKSVFFLASQCTPVQRWSARLQPRYGCLRKTWRALLEKQAIEKAQEESRLQAELEENQALHDYDWINRSRFISVDDSVAATTFRGQSLKVIVKVSWIVELNAVGPRPYLTSCRRRPTTSSSLDRNMRGHGISKEW